MLNHLFFVTFLLAFSFSSFAQQNQINRTYERLSQSFDDDWEVDMLSLRQFSSGNAEKSLAQLIEASNDAINALKINSFSSIKEIIDSLNADYRGPFAIKSGNYSIKKANFSDGSSFEFNLHDEEVLLTIGAFHHFYFVSAFEPIDKGTRTSRIFFKDFFYALEECTNLFGKEKKKQKIYFSNPSRETLNFLRKGSSTKFVKSKKFKNKCLNNIDFVLDFVSI